MNKPRIFLVTLATMAAATLFLVLGLVLYTSTTLQLAGMFLLAFGVVLLGISFVMHLVRQERQNQRENRRSHLQAANIAEVKSEIKRLSSLQSEVPEIVDESHHLLEVGHKQETLSPPKERYFRQTRGITKRKKSPVLKLVRSEEFVSLIKEFKLSSISTKEVKHRFKLIPASEIPPFEFIPLSTQAIEMVLEVDNSIQASLNFNLVSASSLNESRAALVSARAIDEEGKFIDFDCLPSKSEEFGSFSYLASKGFSTGNDISIRIPRQARKLKISVRNWAGDSQLSNSVGVELASINPEWPVNRSARQVKVAGILDEFSYNSFKYECDLLSLDPEDWRKQLDEFQPDLFFCESAWSGADSDKRPWMGRIYSSSNFAYENRKTLMDIISYCNERNIPTVFWNKEDPSHYDDQKHNFVATALIFDHIFTTDLPSVKRYKLEHGHPSVDVLPFAVQPKLFNPMESGKRTDEVIFAGGWYSNHTQRCQAMVSMFEAVENSTYGLKVYDRFYGSADPSHSFPEQFHYALHEPVSNAEMARVYKESTIGMTINTETKSPTMFARRIFELMACNTYVVSNSSVGVKEFFGEDVTYLDEDPDKLKSLNKEYMDEARARNLEKVLSEHTYALRFQKILEVAGISYAESEFSTALLVQIKSMEDGPEVWRRLRDLVGWQGPKVIILDSLMLPLEFSDALTNWNREGVRVVYEGLLLNGTSTLNQVFGKSEVGYLMSSKEFLDGNWSTDEIAKLRIHTQYIDIPIVSADRMKAEKYRLIDAEILQPVLVTRNRYADLTTSRHKKSTVTLYSA